MSTNKLKQIWGSIAFVLAAATLAPAAQAAQFELSRNTGVGQEIAAQGNLALVTIRTELRSTVRGLRARLPARPVPAMVPAGGAVTVAPAQRCEK